MSAAGIKKTVLIVDDNLILTELFDEVLRDSFNIRTASSVAEALSELNVHNIDAVISDYNLGLQNADMIISWILENQPKLARNFILVTGEIRLDSDSNCYKEISSILYKPIKMEALLTTVQSLFDPAPVTQ